MAGMINDGHGPSVGSDKVDVFFDAILSRFQTIETMDHGPCHCH